MTISVFLRLERNSLVVWTEFTSGQLIRVHKGAKDGAARWRK